GHSEPPQAGESGLQYAKGHFYPDSGFGMGHIETGLWPFTRVRIRGHQEWLAGITPVPEQHSTEEP
ncbi:hypothetical protein NQZ68_036922, partial [Dissostichus eleginoides]